MLRATNPCLSYRIFVGVKSQGVKGSIELEGTSKIPGIFSGKGDTVCGAMVYGVTVYAVTVDQASFRGSK
jgi:hypothetical protein